MKREPLISKCCSVPACMEPISLVGEGKTTFARVAVCSSCSKIISEPKWLYGAPINPLKSASWGTSWAMMLEHRMKRVGCPLYFENRNGVLAPEGYAGDKRFQEELADHPPF